MSVPRIIRVLIVDGIPLTRAGLVVCINGWKTHRVCGVAKTAPEARQLCERLRPELIVLDLPLPGGDGFGLVREFAGLHAPARTVVIGRPDDVRGVGRALRAGAHAFVQRSDELDQLRGVRGGFEGRALCEPRPVAGTARRPRAPGAAKP